jgi:hypothetical protein
VNLELRRARSVRGLVALAVVAVAGFVAASAVSSHDPQHRFAGNWAFTFANGTTGTFDLRLVGDAEGLAAMNAIFAVTPCEEPSDYYIGTWNAIAPLAGCTTGDDRSIYLVYKITVSDQYLVATLDSSGAAFSGQLHSRYSNGPWSLNTALSGTFTGHFAGDGHVEPSTTTTGTTTGGATDGEPAPEEPGQPRCPAILRVQVRAADEPCYRVAFTLAQEGQETADDDATKTRGRGTLEGDELKRLRPIEGGGPRDGIIKHRHVAVVTENPKDELTLEVTSARVAVKDSGNWLTLFVTVVDSDDPNCRRREKGSLVLIDGTDIRDRIAMHLCGRHHRHVYRPRGYEALIDVGNDVEVEVLLLRAE